MILEKKSFKCFAHIWAWRPSYLTGHDHLHKFSNPLQDKTLHKGWGKLAQQFREEDISRLNNFIHVYSPGERADNPGGGGGGGGGKNFFIVTERVCYFDYKV